VLQVFQTLPGLIAPVVTGYIVEATKSFDNAFYLTSLILLSGVVITFLFLRPPHKKEGDEITTEPTVVLH
jgi:hypothetical protein